LSYTYAGMWIRSTPAAESEGNVPRCVCVCVSVYVRVCLSVCVQFSHLLRIQRRLGSQIFPLIDQSFYPNYREMMTSLWVSRSTVEGTYRSIPVL